MKKKEIIALVRKLIADEQATGFTESPTGNNLEEPEGTEELLNYLDRAVDEYSRRQAAGGDVRFIKTMTVARGQRVPDDFLFFAGAVPVSVDGGAMDFYGPPTTLPVRYFARLPYVTSCNETEELPYLHDQEIILAALAAIYALNKHEFNVSQDLMLLGMGGVPDAGGQ